MAVVFFVQRKMAVVIFVQSKKAVVFFVQRKMVVLIVRNRRRASVLKKLCRFFAKTLQLPENCSTGISKSLPMGISRSSNDSCQMSERGTPRVIPPIGVQNDGDQAVFLGI